MITYMPIHLLSITIPYRYFYFFGYSICCRNSSLRIVKIFNSFIIPTIEKTSYFWREASKPLIET